MHSDVGDSERPTSFSHVALGIAAADDREVVEQLRSLEVESRRIAAELALVTAQVETRNVHRTDLDGHRSTTAWLRANVNCATYETTRRRRVARLVEAIPEVGRALWDGHIGVGQVDDLARVYANPRCGELLVDSIGILLRHAEHLGAEEFRLCCRRWEALADADGAAEARQSSEERRTAHVGPLDANGESGVHVSATGGSPIDAEEMQAIFAQFVEAEFDADVAERTRLHGADAPAALMRRTDRQRRFDALLAIFRSAVDHPGRAAAAPIVVDVIVDQATFEAALAEHGLIDPPDDLDDLDEALRRCHTASGAPILPLDVVRAALRGHVRRIVVDSTGVIVDVGRKQRLFTGAAREAIKLLNPICHHPGCRVGSRHADIDHVQEWDDGGATDIANGAPRCNAHNRHKHRHRLRAQRDHLGDVTTFRADGSAMVPAGARAPDLIDDHDRHATAQRARDRAAQLRRLPPLQ